MPGAVITGASGKLGSVFSFALARQGYSLVLQYHKRREALAGLEEKLAAMGYPAVCRAADLTSPNDRARFIRESFMQDTMVLINSAACFQKGNIGSSSAEELARVFALNTFAPYDLITNFARMRGQHDRPGGTPRGLVLNILDSKIFHDASGYAAYTLSKKSLADITRLAAREFAPSLRVNAIALACLSPVDDASDAALRARAPLGFTGSEEDLARAVEFFLLSEGVTGQCLCVDGGLSLL